MQMKIALIFTIKFNFKLINHVGGVGQEQGLTASDNDM